MEGYFSCVCHTRSLDSKNAFWAKVFNQPPLQVTEAAGMIIAKSLKLKVETRILTEQDLLDWLAQTLPIGKSLFKSRKAVVPGDQTQGIIDDSLDMKFGRELHSLNLLPNDKLKKRFPAMEKKFVYIPKPVSVGQTDVSVILPSL